jgi:hypothetical protein
MSIFGKKNSNEKDDVALCRRITEEMNSTLAGLLENSENREILSAYGSDIPEKYHPLIEKKLGIQASIISFDKVGLITVVNDIRKLREERNFSEMTLSGYSRTSHNRSVHNWNRIYKNEIELFYLKRLESEGRYDEAAQICESLGNYEEAIRQRNLKRN